MLQMTTVAVTRRATTLTEALKDGDLYNISPTREEIMDEIQSVNAKVEALTDYIGNLVTVTTAGLEGIATTLDDKVD